MFLTVYYFPSFDFAPKRLFFPMALKFEDNGSAKILFEIGGFICLEYVFNFFEFFVKFLSFVKNAFLLIRFFELNINKN